VLHFLQKMSGWHTIQSPVIKHQAEIDRRPNRQGIAQDYWPVLHHTHPENRHLWRVDDRREEVDACGAQVGDRERAIADIIEV
jgi:hypothetical protein